MLISTGIFLVIFSLFVAKAEINIEGKNGWAKNLPTWRKKNILTKMFLGDYPLTGYHLWMFSSFLLLFHFPFILNLNWNISLELKILALFLFFMLLEDFFWFLLNPHFGLKKFSKKYVVWHGEWIGFVPESYLKLFFGGLFLIFLSYIL
jgi:hypothetical protein